MARRNESTTVEAKERNRLLAAVPGAEWSRLEAQFEFVKLGFGQLLHEPDRRIGHLYFPRCGVVSAVKEFCNGDIIEVATIGNEGVAGHSVALHVNTPGNRVLEQVPGDGLRIETGAFLKALPQCPVLHEILLRYSQALFHQVAQTAACNRAHGVDERCARWLLMSHDRVGETSFKLTQDFLSQMLGVHRPSVSIAAGMLQKAGMITYTRGTITIVDREALEAASCECYQLILKQYQNALGVLCSQPDRHVTVPHYTALPGPTVNTQR